ncbi:hypothetical protein N7532_000331 [Penicillium argentinense]|uniref:SAP domain-containing protein n=1 Tax=Penicillium argentinense TaxID=1131581 RepID=A0A9W9G517_9EURO|nr:uncharacterized protein N7532_000331 [Penicillium argentinense]KAJ5112286.1 hypothetical protein N7532_000331 [Penicillium argentinense]
MRPSVTIFGSTARATHWHGQGQWLSSIRLAPLRDIARATGLASSGTRKELIGRIGGALEEFYDRGTGQSFRDEGPLSILSIDMGIQNLAFAHLRVENAFDRDRVGSRPEVRAWRRLALSDISSLSSDGGFVSAQTVILGGNEDASSAQAEEEKAVSTFSLPYYASAAYTLLTTLINKYKPTHILIERQRFRSGGSSVVQEWTLRVGIFEAMLYSTLHTLQQKDASISQIGVHGIEPKRVVQYWGVADSDFGSKLRGKDSEGGKKTKRPTAREVKKAKIELVGRWLEADMERLESGEDVSAGRHHRILLPKDLPSSRLAAAYVEKLRNPGVRGRHLQEDAAQLGDVAKLDDLADCLLQGVTWIEWLRMRERIVRQGVEGLEVE